MFSLISSPVLLQGQLEFILPDTLLSVGTERDSPEDKLIGDRPPLPGKHNACTGTTIY